MSVVTGALGSLGPKLLKLLHDEYMLQKGVRKQVESLSRELDSIYAFLHKVSDVRWDQLDEQVKLWAREVRDASYDMEDIIDTFLVRVDGGGKNADSSGLKLAMTKMGDLFSKAKARRGIAAKIEDMKKLLDEVAERRQKYKLDDIMCKPAASSIDPRLTAMCKEVKQLIGADKSMDELISMLNASDPDDDDMPDKKITKKVSIVGVGGLGKTTLARAVYENLKSQYDCAAFVSVGRDLELVKVFKDILCDLDKEKYGNIHNSGKDEARLIRDIQEFLKNKRYFMVIDDVWDVRTWEEIELSLVDNYCGSKVITTTRKVDVAKAAGEVYKLNSLSCDDSMKLFYTRIFGVDRKYLHSQQPNDVSDKILKKCAGIPLAIITMASLFAGKPECEWSEVYNYIGFDTEDNRESVDTMTILSFSYYDLPPHLRTCLQYLSTYPEDYSIEKDPLIWKWIAEGFIDRKQGIRLFEVGERYFNDLVNRSLIQVEEDWDGRVLGCRVHDMVLDLMRKLSSEENFITLFRDYVEGTPAPSNSRRLSHQNRIAEAMVAGLTKVRSYTAFRCCINVQFLRFKLLRVLDIVNCSFKDGCHLEHIGNLLHLRYLRLIRCKNIPELPKQFGDLKLLQTLWLDACTFLQPLRFVLPACIVQLTQLNCLRVRELTAPEGIGHLTSLEELTIGDYPKGFMKELGALQELRVLKLWWSYRLQDLDESMQRDFVESLGNLKKIRHIRVDCFGVEADTTMWEEAGFVLPRPLCYLELPIRFSKLPSCINSSALPNLSHMKLHVITMDEQDMKRLGRLPSLSFLELSTWSTVTSNTNNAGDGCFFPKLRYFQTNSMVQFEEPQESDARISLHMWNGEDAMPFASRKSNNDSRKVVSCGVMPNLEVLNIDVLRLRALKDNNCDYGNIGLEYLPSLRELKVWINCDGVSTAEVDAALAALRNACKVHPNHPTLDAPKLNEEKMVSTENGEDVTQQSEAKVASSERACSLCEPNLNPNYACIRNLKVMALASMHAGRHDGHSVLALMFARAILFNMLTRISRLRRI